MNRPTSGTAKLGGPVVWRCAFAVQASSHELWGILLDTTRINRAMGVGAMEYVDEDGICRRSTRTRGIEYRWTELPWGWSSGQEMACFRIYDNGLATHGSIQYRLLAEGPGRSRLEIEL